jgi:hypothetical protein
MSKSLHSLDDLVYAALVRAANANERCPTNPDIAHMMGAQSVSSAARAISRLEQRGLIEVRRFSCGRDVRIKETGKSTAPYPGTRNSHWRITGSKVGVAAARPYVRQEERPTPPEPVQLRIVDRDPCPRCGTRADYGCAHIRPSVARAAA